MSPLHPVPRQERAGPLGRRQERQGIVTPGDPASCAQTFMIVWILRIMAVRNSHNHEFPALKPSARPEFGCIHADIPQ